MRQPHVRIGIYSFLLAEILASRPVDEILRVLLILIGLVGHVVGCGAVFNSATSSIHRSVDPCLGAEVQFCLKFQGHDERVGILV